MTPSDYLFTVFPHMSNFLSLCLHFFTPLSLSHLLSFLLRVSICLLVCLSVFLYVCLSISVPDNHPFKNKIVFLFCPYLSFVLSLSLSLSSFPLSLPPSVSPPLSLSLYIDIHTIFFGCFPPKFPRKTGDSSLCSVCSHPGLVGLVTSGPHLSNLYRHSWV